MVKVEQAASSLCEITSENPEKIGFVIHGYGGNKEEMTGLAVNLVENASIKLIVFDLPGHGSLSNEKFNLENSMKRLKNLIGNYSPDFFIGHSVGARLGLMAGIDNGILISMPGSAFFEGRKKDLIKILRVRRVNESSPFNGLEEMLSVNVEPKDKNLLLLADRDIQSVKIFYEEWQNKGFSYKKITGSTHLDIVSSLYVVEAAKKWLEELN